MLVQTTNIFKKTAIEYDRLLAEGWFRGTGVMYRNELVCIRGDMYSVQHIRLPVVNFERRKSHEKIFRRNRELFRVEIGDPEYDEQREAMYESHKGRFLAFIHDKFSEVLQTGFHRGYFDTRELRVYDGDKLIAISYFDHGVRAMASMMCIFDPDYAKYSLGTYTMLEEIEYGRNNRVQYYYPGYILDQPSSFDYKLKLGDYEWMGKDRKWYSKDELPPFESTGMLFRRKAQELKLKIALNEIPAEFKIYPYYTLAYMMDPAECLLRLPFVFLFEENGQQMGASYDYERDRFIVFHTEDRSDCLPSNAMPMSDDYRNGSHYEFNVYGTLGIRSFDDFAKYRNMPQTIGIHEPI
jgi:arginyl-tRNA--protein-N-Asp/Glu arginylyltransferase